MTNHMDDGDREVPPDASGGIEAKPFGDPRGKGGNNDRVERIDTLASENFTNRVHRIGVSDLAGDRPPLALEKDASVV